jgi:hypothetical protein
MARVQTRSQNWIGPRKVILHNKKIKHKKHHCVKTRQRSKLQQESKSERRACSRAENEPTSGNRKPWEELCASAESSRAGRALLNLGGNWATPWLAAARRTTVSRDTRMKEWNPVRAPGVNIAAETYELDQDPKSNKETEERMSTPGAKQILDGTLCVRTPSRQPKQNRCLQWLDKTH